MPLLKPFAGLRPSNEYAKAVVAPPYDVLSSAEARQKVGDNQWSFLHISKPEIDLSEDINVYDPAVYAKAHENLQHMLSQNILLQDKTDHYYIYQMTLDGHCQTGLVAVASVADYDINRIRKHEHTQPDKENDRVKQIEALSAQTGPVLLSYESQPHVDTLLLAQTEKPAVTDVYLDSVRHQLWLVDDQSIISQITAEFDAMPAIYIADGHHRSAAASRVAKLKPNSAHAQYFLVAVFPHQTMNILDYNRVVKDLNGHSTATFLEAIKTNFSVSPSDMPCKPGKPAEFGLYLENQWYHLKLNTGLIPADPVKSLDISLLAHYLIEPLLNIDDPHTDKRIDFVGGIRGMEGLEARVNSGEMAVAFALFPTQMEQLMAVAESQQVMPSKSTWFEPKLADGIVSHLI